MDFQVFGGDERLRELAVLLSREGHGAACLGMERAELPETIRRIASPTEADCVILPVPAVRGGALNAPFSARKLDAAELIRSLPTGSTVFAGMPDAALRAAAEERGIALYDYSSQSGFAVGNAAITAEAAVSICMERLRRTVSGSSVLVIGCGRIGRLLAMKFKALGAEVSVLSRSAETRELMRAAGMSVPGREDIPECLSSFDLIVNTAPAPMLTEAELRSVPESCFVLELASPPYGIAPETAEKLGLNYLNAPGLPGKYAPQTAAVLIKNAVTEIMKERKK